MLDAKILRTCRGSAGLDPDPGSNMKAFLKRVNDVLEQGPVFTVNDLAVDGFDVMKLLDMPEGRKLEESLQRFSIWFWKNPVSIPAIDCWES